MSVPAGRSWVEPATGEPDPVIEAYKKDVDRTLIRENLKRSPEQRVRKLMEMQAVVGELQRAGQKAFGRK